MSLSKIGARKKVSSVGFGKVDFPVNVAVNAARSPMQGVFCLFEANAVWIIAGSVLSVDSSSATQGHIVYVWFCPIKSLLCLADYWRGTRSFMLFCCCCCVSGSVGNAGFVSSDQRRRNRVWLSTWNGHTRQVDQGMVLAENSNLMRVQLGYTPFCLLCKNSLKTALTFRQKRIFSSYVHFYKFYTTKKMSVVTRGFLLYSWLRLRTSLSQLSHCALREELHIFYTRLFYFFPGGSKRAQRRGLEHVGHCVDPRQPSP